MKIVADDKIPFLRGVFEPYAEVVYLSGGKISAADVADADVLLTRTRTRCDAALLAGARVRFIATATIGFDHLDTAYLDAAGIRWTNAAGCNAGSVAQYVASALTGLGVPLSGRVLGIVGVGNVGSRVAVVGEALGMRVLCCDPPRRRRGDGDGFVPLERIRDEADFVTFHVPLNRDGADRTFHLADEAFLAGMKPGAFLLNTSRGEVADNRALCDALRTRRIAGAVLDVWENEPEIDRDLLARVNFGTPHIAGYSADGKANGTRMSVRAVAEFFGIDALRNWVPEAVPAPERPQITLDPALSETERIAAACRACYDIAYDDALLRAAPERFESLRGEYRLRREAGAYTVSPELSEPLRKLGFRPAVS